VNKDVVVVVVMVVALRNCQGCPQSLEGGMIMITIDDHLKMMMPRRFAPFLEIE